MRIVLSLDYKQRLIISMYVLPSNLKFSCFYTSSCVVAAGFLVHQPLPHFHLLLS